VGAFDAEPTEDSKVVRRSPSSKPPAQKSTRKRAKKASSKKKPPAKKAAAKKASTRKKPLAKTAKKRSTQKRRPTRKFVKRTVAKPKRTSNGKLRGTMHNGKPLPPIRQLTKEQMARAMERIRIGQSFPLELGMKIVRKKRDGELVITLCENGFEMEGVVYSSLSTAAMYAERRIVSANAFFNLESNKCTEVRDKRGKPIAGYDALP
jgi:hypothetical protein